MKTQTYRVFFYLRWPLVRWLRKIRNFSTHFGFSRYPAPEAGLFLPLWQNAAERVGVEHEYYEGVFETDKVLVLRQGQKRLFLNRSCTEFDSVVARKFSQDKWIVGQYLRAEGFPVPTMGCFRATDFDSALGFFSSLKRAVVKPRIGGHGHGVTAGIAGASAFSTAFLAALEWHHQVLVEEHINGAHFRMIVYNGNLLSAVNRIPASVTGDGRSSLRELIEVTNRERRSTASRQKQVLCPIIVTHDLKECVRKQNLSLRSVPADGVTVLLKEVCNFHQGGTTVEVIKQVHPDYRELCVAVARAMNLRFVGIDLICEDIRSPLGRANAFINEVNVPRNLAGPYIVSNLEDCAYPLEKILAQHFELERS